MEIKVIDTEVKMLEGDAGALVSYIPKKFEELDDGREVNKALILETKKHLFPHKLESTEDSFNDKKDATELNKLPKVYKTRESAISHYWNSCFKSLMASFNLEASVKQLDLAQMQNNPSDPKIAEFIKTANDNATLMKAAIVDAWTKAKTKLEFRKAVVNFVDKGAAILFVSWETKYKNVRRQVPVKFLGLDTGKTEIKVQQVLDYDGVKIISIDPEDYVMDVSRKGKPGCQQIYRDWVTYSEVEDNQEYLKFLSDQDLLDLKNIADENAPKNNENSGDKKEWDGKAVNKGQLLILDFWGDIKVQDRYLSNMHITVIAKKFVVCFEYNPHIIDPFIYCDFEEHPDTKFAIGPLVRVLPINDSATELFKMQKQAVIYDINKNYLAPKDAMEKQDLNKKGGNIIEYDPALMPREPIPMQYNHSSGWNFMEFFDKEIEVTSGEYAYDVGDDSGKARTLGEAQIISAGNNTRRGLYVSDISEKLLIPCAEKTGELLANYKEEAELLKIKDAAGNEQYKIIDNTIRQGQYEYTVGDTQALADKMAQLRSFAEVTQQIAPLLEASGQSLNGEEIAKYAYSAFQIENPERFISVDPMQKQFSQMTPQQKQMVVQIAQNPQLLQRLQQSQIPSAQQLKDLITKFAVDKSTLPPELKMTIDTFLGLDPTQENNNGTQTGARSNNNGETVKK